MQPSLFSQTPEDLAVLLEGLGEPSYRATQILEWLWQKRSASIEEMRDLSRFCRDFQ